MVALGGARFFKLAHVLVLFVLVLGGLNDLGGRRRRGRPDGRAQGQTAHGLGAAAGERERKRGKVLLRSSITMNNCGKKATSKIGTLCLLLFEWRGPRSGNRYGMGKEENNGLKLSPLVRLTRYRFVSIQGSQIKLLRGCKKFVPAFVYLFCLSLTGSCLALLCMPYLRALYM